jgi:hypothetical protein
MSYIIFYVDSGREDDVCRGLHVDKKAGPAREKPELVPGSECEKSLAVWLVQMPFVGSQGKNLSGGQ